MSTLLLGILIAFLVIAVLISLLEAGGGLVGDSSMVPACLVLMVVVLGVVTAIGLLTGQIVISFH